jgi:malate dehydrogenase (oxaloacetate-decarboxylating)
VLAGLLNAAKVVGKEFMELMLVISGAGAAGNAIAKLLRLAGLKDDPIAEGNDACRDQ